MDKDENVEEQEVQPSPPTEESPEVETIESPPEEVDKDFNEWADNKGFNEEQLKNPDTVKALNMARNAEKFVGKKRTEEQEEPEDDTDIDKWVDEILGETPVTESKPVESKGINFENMSPQEKQAFDFLKKEAKEAAEKAVAPALKSARKQEMKIQYDKLSKEFGKDFSKSSVEILKKVRDNPGTSLEDATRSVLMDKLLKKNTDEAIKKGKEIHKKELAEQTESVKKTETKTISEEWKDFSLAEQEKLLYDIQDKV